MRKNYNLTLNNVVRDSITWKDIAYANTVYYSNATPLGVSSLLKKKNDEEDTNKL